MKLHQSIIILALAFGAPAFSDTAHQPYKYFAARDISSLSAQDIHTLEAGSGWGLALPAELNGFPGPTHVLELRDMLDLTNGQVDAIKAIYDAMKAEAIKKGRRLIAAEQTLDEGFRSGGLDDEELSHLIAAAEKARAQLRFVHLSRHLRTADLLTADQISEYAKLRGYGPDRCRAAPDGHDPDKWRRHNGCAAQ